MAHETAAALRWVVVAAMTLSAAAHLPGIEHHLAEAPYMAVLFALYTGVALGLAVLLALEPTRRVLKAAAATCAMAILAYAATRLVAFPQLAHDLGHWRDPLGVLAVLSQLIAIGAAGALVQARPVPRVAHQLGVARRGTAVETQRV